MTAVLLTVPVFKEVRALAFPWLACLFVMILPAVAGAPEFLGDLSVPAYFLGAAALGALSIGHEYTGRTLGLLLSLPARRERLLLVKGAVLASMLLTLWAVADTLVFRVVRAPESEKLAASLLPVLCAFFLAPWLTMACRNPIAGTVFTLAIPGMLLALGAWVGATKYGPGPESVDVMLTILWRGALILCAIGGVASWRLFMRLEAIDGPGADVRLPQWLPWPARASTTAPAVTKRPIWLLVKKELHLHQMALAVAGLYLLGWVAVVSLRPLIANVDDVFTVLTVFYVALLALLIGSNASAGERQLGTLEWQVLLPVATSKQWAVKVGVVWVLALVLAAGLPTVYTSLTPGMGPTQLLRPKSAAAIVLLTASSLYTSSLCSSGLWALLMTLAAIVGAGTLLGAASNWGIASYAATVRMRSAVAPAGVGGLPPTQVLALLISAVFAAVLLRLALANHRSADRGAGRVWRQAILITVIFIAGLVMFLAIEAFRR